MLNIKKVLAATLVLLSFSSVTSFASTSYNTYTYNNRLEAVPSLSGYEPETVLSGGDLGIGKLTTPKDMTFDKTGNLLIVDSGANRILKLDKSYKIIKIINGFMNNGKKDKFNAPEGIFVNEENDIFVADTQNGRIIKLDSEGNLLQEIKNVKAQGASSSFNFQPQKLSVDSAGRIFVVSTGNTDGLIQLDSNGSFVRFFGSNKVQPNPIEILYRKFLTRAQRQKREQFVPTEYSNVLVDKDGFVYATTKNVKINQVKRLNSLGNDVLKHYGRTENVYGDPFRTDLNNSQFLDVMVDNNNNVFALDNASGKIFEYDIYGNLLFEFGGVGESKGLFTDPVAIEINDNKVLVLDESLGSLTIFKLSAFGQKVITANNYYVQGKYQEAMEPWKEVLKYNSNYDLAYVGIGKALFQQEDYKGAMKNFKIALDRRDYSKAYSEYRTEIIRNNFTLVVIIIFAAIILLKILSKFISKRNELLKRHVLE